MDVTDGVIGQSVRRSQILHMYLDGSTLADSLLQQGT